MRSITILSLLIIATTTIRAQNYLISFAGAGSSLSVDSVRVDNLTQGTSLTVFNGNQLQLLGTLSGIYLEGSYSGSALHIYPNPSKGNVLFTFAAIARGKTTIELYSLPGRQVAKTEFYSEPGWQSFQLSGLKSGFYTVQITSERFQYTGKIISQSTSVDPVMIICQEESKGHPYPGNLKQKAAIVQMQYNPGDLLKFTGKSGNYGTVYMDVPAESKTITFNFVPCTDYDNNNYTVVQIGDQLWTAENLKTTKYSNGEDIPEVSDASQWMNLSTGAFCYFGNDPDNALIYGCLYNWLAAIDNRNACPVNWHIPSDDEWITLTSSLGGEAVAGGKMKETGIEHWFSPNAGATNESGFTAIAGGNRSYGNFDSMGYGGSFWSVTAIDPIFAWGRDIFYYNTVANRHGTDKKSGLSLRCVKD